MYLQRSFAVFILFVALITLSISLTAEYFFEKKTVCSVSVSTRPLSNHRAFCNYCVVYKVVIKIDPNDLYVMRANVFSWLRYCYLPRWRRTTLVEFWMFWKPQSEHFFGAVTRQPLTKGKNTMR